MGGNALKHLNVHRIGAAEYGLRLQQFDSIVENITQTDTTLAVVYGFPMPLFGKEDHGDLDVIFWASDPERFRNYLIQAFNSRGQKKNGQVTSVEWDNFQVDLIYTDISTFDWELNWYSHGDASAVKGRVYRYYNFKFGHDGLYYNIKTKNFSKDIFVTHDWVGAHKLMGYKALLNSHMYSESDIFTHTVSSPYVHANIFDVLKPDRDRKTQTGFYDWVRKLHDEGGLSSDIKPRSFGLQLLWKYNKLLCIRVVLEHQRMKARELYNPIKKKVRKFLWTKVYPKVFKVQGRL